MYTEESIVGKTFQHQDPTYIYKIIELNQDGSFITYSYYSNFNYYTFPKSIQQINTWIEEGIWREFIINPEIY